MRRHGFHVALLSILVKSINKAKQKPKKQIGNLSLKDEVGKCIEVLKECGISLQHITHLLGDLADTDWVSCGTSSLSTTYGEGHDVTQQHAVQQILQLPSWQLVEGSTRKGTNNTKESTKKDSHTTSIVKKMDACTRLSAVDGAIHIQEGIFDTLCGNLTLRVQVCETLEQLGRGLDNTDETAAAAHSLLSLSSIAMESLSAEAKKLVDSLTTCLHSMRMFVDETKQLAVQEVDNEQQSATHVQAVADAVSKHYRNCIRLLRRCRSSVSVVEVLETVTQWKDNRRSGGPGAGQQALNLGTGTKTRSQIAQKHSVPSPPTSSFRVSQEPSKSSKASSQSPSKFKSDTTKSPILPETTSPAKRDRPNSPSDRQLRSATKVAKQRQ